MNTELKINQTKILDILINKKILIPIYQRNYVWQKEHIDALIDDIIAREEDNSIHYFGVIALSKKIKSGKNGEDITISRIIDGQQRLTTSLILYCYLARKCKNINIDTSNLMNPKNSKLAFEHEMDDSTLKSNIDNLIKNNPSSLKGNFGTNYRFINERLEKYPYDYIEKLFETFRNKFVVAILNYKINKEEEMLVFENLNSKGSPLKPFDLIRNHILAMCENDAQENLKLFNKQIWNLTQNKYSNIAKTDTKKEEKLERFMEFYLIFEKSKELNKYANYAVYKNFKDIFKNQKNISKNHFEEFLFKMRKFLILYLNLETKTSVGKNIWLKTLTNKDNHYFFVFALFQKLGKFNEETEEWIINNDIQEYLKVIAIHILKILAVQGTGQSFTKMYINITKLFVNENITAKKLKQMLEEGEILVTKVTPTDAKFVEALGMAPKLRWIPHAIIDILENIANQKNVANEIVDYQEKSIEHILPQKARQKDWPFIVDQQDKYNESVNQIGNLVNFNKNANSKLGNKSFAQKLETYRGSNSPLITGRDLNIDPLTDLKEFTFETIKKRTQELAEELKKEFNK